MESSVEHILSWNLNRCSKWLHGYSGVIGETVSQYAKEGGQPGAYARELIRKSLEIRAGISEYPDGLKREENKGD